MSHFALGVSPLLHLLCDVKQFLFFIEYRLQTCDSADDALEILHDVDVALWRLDQAMALIPRGRRAASAMLVRDAAAVGLAATSHLQRVRRSPTRSGQQMTTERVSI